MSWVDPLALVYAAREGGYAVGAFNMHSDETTQALVLAAEQADSPMFLQVGRAVVPHMGLAAATAMTRRWADESSANLVLHLDHGPWEECIEAIQLGFGSIMYDGAHLPFEENIASTRRIVRADKMIRRGEWTKRIPNRFGPIAGLTGGKLGILGLGAIGLEFVKRAKGFDMEIGYCNRSQRADVDFPYFPDVMALATWCDSLVVCLRSDASNRHIINADVLKALGPRGHVVNISRGWAVDEAAVAHALRSGIIEGAALDVFDEEPYTGTELLGLDNLVMTPHFGGGTEHAQRRMTAMVCRNLDNHFAGKPVVSPVPELRDMAANTQGRLR